VYLWEKVKKIIKMLLNEKIFYKERFVLKIVPNMEKRGKDKPSE
jgi:hypothetical protein